MVGRSCSIKNCRSEQYPGCPFHFRRIPSKPSKQELRQKWLQALEGKTKRDTFTKNTVVCSLHFKPSDYLDTSKRVLKDNAVPSVFPENTGGYLSTFQKLVASKRVNVNPSLLVPVIKKNAVSSILPNPDVTYPKPIKEEIKMESDPLDGIKNSPLQEYIIEEAATSPRSAFTASPFHSHNSQDYTSLLEEPSEELILVPSFRESIKEENTDPLAEIEESSLQEYIPDVATFSPSPSPSDLSQDATSLLEELSEELILYPENEIGVQFSPTVIDVGSQIALSTPEEDQLKKQVKALQGRLKRREAKLTQLRSVLETMKKERKLKEKLGKRKENKSDKNMRYSDDQRQFALTLYFQSPKAYEFLRDYMVLPHPASLRKY